MQKATFAAGCFWGVEASFQTIDGVQTTIVGYSGGKTFDPTYEDVCTGSTGHAEVVEINFDPSIVTYENILRAFFNLHDPTTLNRQGPDIGTQYRSAIFYHSKEQKQVAIKVIEELNLSGKFSKPIVTTVEQASKFYEAEEYHQKYLAKRGMKSCKI